MVSCGATKSSCILSASGATVQAVRRARVLAAGDKLHCPLAASCTANIRGSVRAVGGGVTGLVVAGLLMRAIGSASCTRLYTRLWCRVPG